MFVLMWTLCTTIALSADASDCRTIATLTPTEAECFEMFDTLAAHPRFESLNGASVYWELRCIDLTEERGA